MKIASIIYLAIGAALWLVFTGVATKTNYVESSCLYDTKGVKGKTGLACLALAALVSNCSMVVTWPVVVVLGSLGIWLTDKKY